jgi:hypothetical protein
MGQPKHVWACSLTRQTEIDFPWAVEWRSAGVSPVHFALGLCTDAIPGLDLRADTDARDTTESVRIIHLRLHTDSTATALSLSDLSHLLLNKFFDES